MKIQLIFSPLKIALILFASLFVILTLAMGTWLYRLDQLITTSFAGHRFIPPVEFYTAPERITAKMILVKDYLITSLDERGFRLRSPGLPIHPGDYSKWSSETCSSKLKSELPPETITCVAWKNQIQSKEDTPPLQIVALKQDDEVLQTYSGEPGEIVAQSTLSPELFAQFLGEEPVFQKVTPLGETPVNCMNAVLAIEDSRFLEHNGISATSILRAFYHNLKSGKILEGGSTITQQLVKNYFLTSERTFSRKIKEIIMSLMVELRVSKDDILDTYLNTIYVGQNGPFQVRGFGAAAQHYFGSELKYLNLSECALLAAIINSPGLYNPFTKKENATLRRKKVLERMHELKLISQNMLQDALLTPLPQKTPKLLSDPAPFFVDAVRKEIARLNIFDENGLKIFTTLNRNAQDLAASTVKEVTNRIENDHPRLKKLKEQGKSLESALISADIETGEIQAIVGGKNFIKSQFNRAIEGKRQIGSLVKPFVFLTALTSADEEGHTFSPTSELNDESFKYRYEGQHWTPHNYNNKFFGKVPAYFALKNSLNAATASIGIKVGLKNIVDVIQVFGLAGGLKPLPSITLGAFELTPRDVLQGYLTIARMGSLIEVGLVNEVQTLSGEVLYQRTTTAEQVYEPAVVAEVVGMMKQTILSGTAKSLEALGFSYIAAGKTGTTNDNKDAWFAGFTPHHVTVVWTGYDDNTAHGLTGASGAIPIWGSFMKERCKQFPNDDFKWPENTELKEVEDFEVSDKKVELVFRK